MPGQHGVAPAAENLKLRPQNRLPRLRRSQRRRKRTRKTKSHRRRRRKKKHILRARVARRESGPRCARNERWKWLVLLGHRVWGVGLGWSMRRGTWSAVRMR